jgi:hypothetical protein
MGALMEGLFIIQLVGVAGLFIGLGFFISIVLKMHRTLTEMECTLKSLGTEIEELTPRVSSALQEIERTGEDIGIMANATTALINRVNGRDGTSPVVDGAVRMLPALISAARHVIPMFRSRKNRS